VRAAIAIVLVACGGNGNSTTPTCADAGPACGSACAVVFTGNFASSSTSAANCAQVGPGSGGDTVLAFSLGTDDLDAPLAITIDLGAAPVAGAYSSETSADWSALGLHQAAAGACVYSAGADGVPQGSFTLTLTAIDPATAHGELDVIQYVQAQQGVDCGSGDNEVVDVRF
jgi:hypothetical protein